MSLKDTLSNKACSLFYISVATVTQWGVVCPLTSQLPSRIDCFTIIACIPYYNTDFAFASPSTLVGSILQWLHTVVQDVFFNRGLLSAALQRWWWRGLLLLARLATSDPPLPLRLCFTADRRSARAPPARVIYDRQLLFAAHDPHSWVSDVVSL